jgi:hypothetical protein
LEGNYHETKKGRVLAEKQLETEMLIFKRKSKSSKKQISCKYRTEFAISKFLLRNEEKALSSTSKTD